MKYFLILVLLLTGCNLPSHEKGDEYLLRPVDSFLDYIVDSDVHIPLFNLYTFEVDGNEFLTFSDAGKRTILIYNLTSGKLLKKIPFSVEGPNGIGANLFGYYIADFEHIYVPNFNRSIIYQTDTSGIIRKIFDFSQTMEKQRTTSSYYVNQNNKQLFFMGDSLYIPQSLNRNLGSKWLEKSPAFVVLDTVTEKVKQSQFLYPHGKISPEKYNSYIVDLSYSSICREEEMIYSFAMEDELYKINMKTDEIKKIPAKSRYIDAVVPERMPNDFIQLLKTTCERPNYGNILYDKYRNVYYRFAFPETELASGMDYRKVLHSGKKEFSIIILDEKFDIIGETKFPAFTYLPHICFIREDGLYLSISHFMREDYSDDLLRFQRIELIKNE